MSHTKHLTADEILDTVAEYCALQLPDETKGKITVEWDEEGGVNIYIDDYEESSNSNLDNTLN